MSFITYSNSILLIHRLDFFVVLHVESGKLLQHSDLEGYGLITIKEN